MKLDIIFISLSLLLSGVSSDGERDYGESCSFRSQIVNFFRTEDSPQGCMSSKGLICISHKCTCDPTSTYENPMNTQSEPSKTGLRASIGGFFKKIMGTEETTTEAPSNNSPSGGRCVGKSGSPCLTANATCVEHASCEGSPKICRCQGIYSSTTGGLCSKRATLANQAFKGITSLVG